MIFTLTIIYLALKHETKYDRINYYHDYLTIYTAFYSKQLYLIKLTSKICNKIEIKTPIGADVFGVGDVYCFNI